MSQANLTAVSAVVPELPLEDLGPVLVVTVADSVTAADFAAAIERLQQADIDTKVVWNWNRTRPSLRYRDGAVRVLIDGPKLRDERETPPDAEEELLRQAIAHA